MANNRMFLLHRPTGRAVYLGKRMLHGWYDAPPELTARMDRLFEDIGEDTAAQDDFQIVMEDATHAPCASQDWQYANGGADKLRMIPIEPDSPDDR